MMYWLSKVMVIGSENAFFNILKIDACLVLGVVIASGVYKLWKKLS